VFRGQFRYTIDPKGRLSIPSKFRETLNSSYGDRLVIVPVAERALEVHPMAEWQAIEEKVNALSRFDPQVRRFRERYVSLGEDVTLDPQGRIHVRQECRERTGLTRDVVIVGMGRYFDVWDQQRWEEHQQEDATPIDDLFRDMAQKGVL
jgi:MraZ protein